MTNGLGGYASQTVTGACTRRYHGLLIAALPNPLGRRMMFNHLTEQVRLSNGGYVAFGGQERVGHPMEAHTGHLADFRLETGLPLWRYDFNGSVLERRVFLPYRQNTVCISYRLLSSAGPVGLQLRPSVHFRSAGKALSELKTDAYGWNALEAGYEVLADSPVPPLRLRLVGSSASFHANPLKLADILYPVEERRGYEARHGLWSPGHFWFDLAKGETVTLIGSAESWETILSLEPQDELRREYARRRSLVAAAHPDAQTGVAAELVLAADQFIILPAARPEEAVRTHPGEEACTVIAGYHWFTDWGRDSMISLEGLSLLTGRRSSASHCLRMFAHHLRDGLIPNLFPEGQQEGVYNTADATLWFFHALDRYLEITGDRAMLRLLLSKLLDIVNHHLRGTRFGIQVDPKDGLLRQGAEGYALTWMDAKVGDWVVTPRRGKAVEINALWYNALRLLDRWLHEEQGEGFSRPIAEHAARAHESFNKRFWYEEGGYLYDVVDGEDGDDAVCRPNQILALSLSNPVLDKARWEAVVTTVQQRLLTPIGLRTLAPGHPEYKPQYFGDQRARDAAYHQGTVWPWLIGPFIDAWLKVHPDNLAGARRFLDGFAPHLGEACMGSVSEVFDAEEPFTPRGCIAQAWSVAELVRCWVKTSPTDAKVTRASVSAGEVDEGELSTGEGA